MWKSGSCAALLLIATGWSGLAHAEEAASPAELVARLGDESFSVRNRARYVGDELFSRPSPLDPRP